MESVDDKDAQIAALRAEVQELQEAKQLMEREFGEGRAKLKQLYLQKEEEVRALTVELEEANSRVVIAECTADNRVETEQRKFTEEIATLEQLYREEAEAAEAEARERQQQLQRENRRLEADKRKILQLYHQLQEELEQQRAATPPPSGAGAGLLSPGLLSGITKSIIAKHVPSLSGSAPPTSPPPPTTSSTSGSDVTTTDLSGPPSGGETNPAFNDGSSDTTEGTAMDDLLGSTDGGAAGAGDRSSMLEEVLLPLSGGEGGEQRVGAQEASLSDLELYSGLLKAQKESLTEQLAAATALTAASRRAEAALKAQARRANDQLLRCERRHLLLLDQLHQLLAPDQLLQLLEHVNKPLDEGTPTGEPGVQDPQRASPKGRGTPDEDEENVYEEVQLPEKGAAAAERGETSLEKDDDADAALLAAGGQVVTASEWTATLHQLRHLTRTSASCTSCPSLQSKVAELQTQLQDEQQQKQVLQKAVERQAAELEREEKYRSDMNDRWLEQVEQYQQKEAEWSTQLQEATRLHDALLTKWKGVMAELRAQLASLTGDREASERHIGRVQRENARLAGKHLKKARLLQEELIDLPHSVEELQLVLLRLKEEVITATVAREEAEEALVSTRALLEATLQEERQQARALQEGLQRDNRSLREAVGRLQASLGPEPPTEEQQQQKTLELHALKEQLNDMLLAKRALEGEVGEQRARVQSLQHDLELSEQTQRDFVRLSQDLQVQLEKIRQSDSEVRWQHEDDVDDCNGCKKTFSAVRRKHHCRHCGRVFCGDCVSKTVTAGRSNRQCRVCNVCHTLLVKTATPYFSEALRQQ